MRTLQKSLTVDGELVQGDTLVLTLDIVGQDFSLHTRHTWLEETFGINTVTGEIQYINNQVSGSRFIYTRLLIYEISHFTHFNALE